MTDLLPFVLPLEQVQEWKNAWYDAKVKHYDLELFVAIQAARWGADQELEACCEWFLSEGWHPDHPNKLRSDRRPKPQSLKEQALVALSAIALGADDTREFYQDIETIKTALEQLDD